MSEKKSNSIKMQKLSCLEPKEVSLVSRGANKRKFIIFKSDEKERSMNPKELLTQITKADPKMMGRVEDILSKTISKEGEDPSDGLSDQAQAALRAIVRILSPVKDEISPELLDQVLEAAGIDSSDSDSEEEVSLSQAPNSKKDQAQESPNVKKEDSKEIPSTPQEEKVEEKKEDSKEEKKEDSQDQKDLVENEKSNDNQSLEQKVALNEQQPTPTEGENVEKSTSLDLSKLPVDIRKSIEAHYNAQFEAVKKEKAELEKIVKAEREIRLKKEFIEKASHFKNAQGSKEELAEVLKSLFEKDTELFKKVENVLKAYETQISKSALFTEVGKYSAPVSQSGDTYERIEMASKDYIAKQGLKMNDVEGFAHFISEVPEGKEMYKNYRLEKEGI